MLRLTRRNWLVLAVVGIPALALILSTDGCTDAPGARQALLKAGYKPLTVGGRGWFKGHRGEWYVTRFTAVNPQGDTVRGVVGRGYYPESAIRLDRP